MYPTRSVTIAERQRHHGKRIWLRTRTGIENRIEAASVPELISVFFPLQFENILLVKVQEKSIKWEYTIQCKNGILKITSSAKNMQS